MFLFVFLDHSFWRYANFSYNQNPFPDFKKVKNHCSNVSKIAQCIFVSNQQTPLTSKSLRNFIFLPVLI